jgi:hypothetical protein
MINLEMTQKMIDVKSGMNNMATSMLRPIARHYDENEHQYPQELDMFRSIKIMSRPKKKNEPFDGYYHRRDVLGRLGIIVVAAERGIGKRRYCGGSYR